MLRWIGVAEIGGGVGDEGGIGPWNGTLAAGKKKAKKKWQWAEICLKLKTEVDHMVTRHGAGNPVGRSRTSVGQWVLKCAPILGRGKRKPQSKTKGTANERVGSELVGGRGLWDRV